MRTVYYHGDLVTMDAARPAAEALVVEDGRILAVGGDGEMLAWREKDTRLVDLEGRAMCPGFIDGHSHFAGVANSLRLADLSGAHSFDQVVELLRRFLAEHEIKPGGWIIGSGYDHNFMEEGRHPDRHVLDQVSTDHPIVISHVSSHMGVVNSKALAVMGIGASTPDPEGGRYGREEGGQEPDGYMEENAFIRFQNQVPMPGLDEMAGLIERAQQIYASHGITTVQDGMVSPPLFEILRYASSKGKLKLDVVGYVDLNGAHGLTREHPEYVKRYKDHLKLGGYKIFLDGSPQGRTAWLCEPYEAGAEGEGYRGYPVLKDERLYELIRVSLEEQMQLLAHCNGDAAARQYLTQFEKALADAGKMGEESCRPVMIHAQFLRRDQIPRMKAVHMAPSFFVAHTYYWGDVHIRNMGRERAGLISPAKSAAEAGLFYTFHQDSPVLPPDMMKTVWCAVNRKTREGELLNREECVTTYEALEAITTHGAYQYFEEGDKGVIAAGFLADLVILDQNPLKTEAEALDQVKVWETIKGGETVYRAEDFE